MWFAVTTPIIRHAHSVNMALSAAEAEPLTQLLKAKSKAVVSGLCREAFTHRNAKVPDEVLASAATLLEIKPQESLKLYQSLTTLIKAVLFSSVTSSSDIKKFLPGDFHDNLKNLLSDIIAKSIPDWRTQVLSNQVSLPKLLDFDWRVDVKTSSDNVTGIATPTCFVQMKVQGLTPSTDQMAPVSSINVEFSKETLDTMLDGLGKIRDQLSSVAKTT